MSETNTSVMISDVPDSSFHSGGFYEKPPYLSELGEAAINDTVSLTNNIPTQADRRKQAINPKGVSGLKLLKQERSFQLLQSWEGRVDEVQEGEMVATIRDKTNPSNPEEGVVISLGEVSEEDQKLVRPGAVFYWSIGYEGSPGFPRRRISQIRFRRLPGWTKREIKNAEKKAEEFSGLFG